MTRTKDLTVRPRGADGVPGEHEGARRARADLAPGRADRVTFESSFYGVCI